MVPSTPTSLPIKNLSPEDFYTLNTIPRVELLQEKHGEYSLNDLIVEMSHLIDGDKVRDIELGIMQDEIKKEWNLNEDFNLVESRNNEIDLVMREIEEIAWRGSQALTKSEYESVKTMVSIDRNWRAYDKEFYDNDMKSMDAFFAKANNFDDRIKHLENWLCRKELEYNARVNLPTMDLKKPDPYIHAIIEKPIKKARENLLGKILT